MLVKGAPGRIWPHMTRCSQAAMPYDSFFSCDLLPYLTPVTGGITPKCLQVRSFDIVKSVHLNQLLYNQSSCQGFESP